jgi:hypothetical protein
MLPPQEVMQSFLTNYSTRYQPYYPCVSGGRLDPNMLMQLNNSKATSLLLLLMVASGAISTPTVEARYLASGMTEACRISLFDLIEKDVFQARDPVVLQSALHFTTLAVWSGDKWHMDVSSSASRHCKLKTDLTAQIAMGQRGMYLAVRSLHCRSSF